MASRTTFAHGEQQLGSRRWWDAWAGSRSRTGEVGFGSARNGAKRRMGSREHINETRWGEFMPRLQYSEMIGAALGASRVRIGLQLGRQGQQLAFDGPSDVATPSHCIAQDRHLAELLVVTPLPVVRPGRDGQANVISHSRDEARQLSFEQALLCARRQLT